jgi:ubiquitin C-terminal hydrolase
MGSCAGKSKITQSISPTNVRGRKKGNKSSAKSDKTSNSQAYEDHRDTVEEKSPRKTVLTPSRKFDLNYTVIPNKIHREATIWEDQIFGLVGLGNLGNTCFMNSALQCLLNTSPLTDYFLSDLHVQEINTENFLGSKGSVVNAYAELAKSIWESDSLEYFPPTDFYHTLGEFAP